MSSASTISSGTAATDPRILELLGELPPHLFSGSFIASAVEAERYGAEWTLELAHRLGLAAALEAAPEAGASAAEVRSHRGFVASFEPALSGLLDALGAAGHLEAEGGGLERRFRLAGALRRPERGPLRRRLLELDPRNAPTLDLLDAAGEAYPEVAAGRVRGEEVLLGPAGSALWARYFTNENPLYGINNRVAAVAAANRLPAGEPLRLLEVGAGFGSASQALLEELSGRGLSGAIAAFQVTEPFPFFRRRCQRTLAAAWPEIPLSFAELDIDAPWAQQGVPPGSLHLVFGVNVLHVARDLAASLRQALAALAPGGWLVAGECLRPFPGQPLSAELIFRLLEGFLQVETDPVLRPQAGFLTPEQWCRALEGAGFIEVGTVPDLRPIRQLTPYFLTGAVCGRRPR